MNTDLTTSAGWSAFPGTRGGAAAEGCVTRLPVPVSWDTPGALPCELAFGFLPHDGPWKRHRKAGAEVPRGHVANLTTLRRRRASLEVVWVAVPGNVSSQNIRRNPFRTDVPEFPMKRRAQAKELGGRSLRELLGPSWASPFGPACDGSEIVPVISVALRGSAEEGFASE